MSVSFVPPARLHGVGRSAIRDLFDRAPAGSINLGLGEPDLGPPAAVRHAAALAAERERNGYTPHAGLADLRERIAADRPSVAASDVVVTAGSAEALYVALMSLVDAGDEVLVPDPGFVAFATLVRLAGGVPVPYRLAPERAFALDRDAFVRALGPRTRAVVLNSPSNPTGRALSDDDLRWIADALDGTSVYVVSDEIYRDLYFGDAQPGSIADAYERTLVIGGLSKSHAMTGWRLGWVVAPPEVTPHVAALHGYVTTCASSVSQKAALAAWSAPALESVALARATYRSRAGLLRELLRDELGVESVAPDGAFYVMAETAALGTSAEVSERFLEAGVVTVPGSAFGAHGEGFTRVSVCASEADIVEGVRRMALAAERLSVARVV